MQYAHNFFLNPSVLRCSFSSLKAAPASNTSRRRQAWSESDEDEPLQRPPDADHAMHESEAEVGGVPEKLHGDDDDDDGE